MANPAPLEPSPYAYIFETDPSNPNLKPDIYFDDLSLPEDFFSDLGFDDDLYFTFDDLPFVPGNEEDCLAGDGSAFLSSSMPVDPAGGVPSLCQDSKVIDEGLCDTGSGLSSSSQVSDDRNSDFARFLISPSPNSGGSGPVSSQDSGGCNSGTGIAAVLNSSSPESGGYRLGVDGVLNSLSPDSSSCDPGFLGSASSNSGNIGSDIYLDQKCKLDEDGKPCLSKRKKGKEDGNPNPKISKVRRSAFSDNSHSPYPVNAGTEEEEKRKARLMRNRESAQLSRERKKHYVEELKDKVRSMHSTITELNSKISFIMAENASLRQQLGGGGIGMPPSGFYPPPPMAPVAYPWAPCASSAMNPQGSKVTLVAIPKLKTQQSLLPSKAKKSENKKNNGRTKKVASVSFLGFLFFVWLLGGLVPLVNVRYGVSRDAVQSGFDFPNNGFNGQPHGRVLTVRGRVKGANQSEGVGLFTGKSSCEQNEGASWPSPGSDGFVGQGNDSEPLVASLYVPRNDKLVKIDGNLIIHSVLASEQTMASSRSATGPKGDKETEYLLDETKEMGLAIPANLVPAVAGRNAASQPHLLRSTSGHQKALTSGSGDNHTDNLKATTADGSLQQWFREGLAGPLLSSGMCTEVFQFNISPASANPGAIVPATEVVNISAERPPDSAQLRGKSRRILNRPAIPLSRSALNRTEQHFGRPLQDDNLQSNKSVSSMVVSVLVDPRDIKGDGVISPLSLPRIFIVVLLDGIKYVTYSCMLPLKGSSPHLVTA